MRVQSIHSFAGRGRVNAALAAAFVLLCGFAPEEQSDAPAAQNNPCNPLLSTAVKVSHFRCGDNGPCWLKWKRDTSECITSSLWTITLDSHPKTLTIGGSGLLKDVKSRHEANCYDAMYHVLVDIESIEAPNTWQRVEDKLGQPQWKDDHCEPLKWEFPVRLPPTTSRVRVNAWLHTLRDATNLRGGTYLYVGCRTLGCI